MCYQAYTTVRRDRMVAGVKYSRKPWIAREHSEISISFHDYSTVNNPHLRARNFSLHNTPHMDILRKQMTANIVTRLRSVSNWSSSVKGHSSILKHFQFIPSITDHIWHTIFSFEKDLHIFFSTETTGGKTEW